jgi:acetyltransferase-like isoleucine patch superfamily enzyme
MSAPHEDPFVRFGQALTKARTLWMGWTYPFAGFGRDVSIHYTCDIRRPASARIRIGDSVYIAANCWISVPAESDGDEPAIVFGSGSKIGRNATIAAKNLIHFEEDVLLGPGVLVTDHSHEFADIHTPIHAQGVTPGGRIRVERNCWLGRGAAVICTSGELVIGRNSVVAANAIVNRSVPPYSVVAGSPAKIVKRFDLGTGQWVKC